MEQSCYKCGQAVDEGRPFCPHCAAPQIRVLLPEPAPMGASFQEIAASQSSADLPASQTLPVLALPMRWSQAAGPCAIAALVAAVAMVLKLMVPLIAAIGAGFLAVILYRRRNPEIALRVRTGARLGALCGFFCFGMSAVLAALRVALLHEGDEIRRAMFEALQQQAVRYSDPQFQSSMEFIRSPAGLIFMTVFLLMFAFLFFLLMGAVGGALGGAAFGRRSRD